MSAAAVVGGDAGAVAAAAAASGGGWVVHVLAVVASIPCGGGWTQVKLKRGCRCGWVRGKCNTGGAGDKTNEGGCIEPLTDEGWSETPTHCQVCRYETMMRAYRVEYTVICKYRDMTMVCITVTMA